MHSKLNATVKSLVSEAWSELQDGGNVLPMREWGAELLSLLIALYGEAEILNMIDTMYAETFPDEENNDNDDF